MTRVRVEPLADAVLLAQLESSDGLNRLSLELLHRLASLPAAHPKARGFVLAGSARCFSAGADLGEISSLAPAVAWRLAREGQGALRAIASSPVPFVAAVSGHCLGGGFDLALACRARVCTPDAYFGHHGARLGLITGWCGTQTLPRLLGSAHTLEHLLAAQGWPAPLALSQGLVRAVVPVADLARTAAALLPHA